MTRLVVSIFVVSRAGLRERNNGRKQRLHGRRVSLTSHRSTDAAVLAVNGRSWVTGIDIRSEKRAGKPRSDHYVNEQENLDPIIM